jgi:hypothetical protein
VIDATNNNWVTSPPAVAQSGNLQFTSVTVNQNVIWTVPSGLTIKVTGAFSLAQNAHLQVQPHGAGAGISVRESWTFEEGLSPSAATAAQILVAWQGGGAGAAHNVTNAALGGGAIVIRAQGGITIDTSASIQANGANAGATSPNGGWGGGGGGVIVLASPGNIANLGTIAGNGGSGGNGVSNSCGGGGGGGGIVHLLSPNAATTGGTLSVNGGAGGTTAGTGDNEDGFGGGASAGNGGQGGGCFLAPAGPAGAGDAGRIIRTAINPATIF